jgi:hypothetical protein
MVENDEPTRPSTTAIMPEPGSPRPKICWRSANRRSTARAASRAMSCLADQVDTRHRRAESRRSPSGTARVKVRRASARTRPWPIRSASRPWHPRFVRYRARPRHGPRQCPGAAGHRAAIMRRIARRARDFRTVTSTRRAMLAARRTRIFAARGLSPRIAGIGPRGSDDRGEHRFLLRTPSRPRAQCGCRRAEPLAKIRERQL